MKTLISSESKIKSVLYEYLGDNFLLGADASAVAEQDSLVAKGIVDSTGVLELVAFIEEKFGLRVEDDELVSANFDTIRNLTAYIERKTNHAAA